LKIKSPNTILRLLIGVFLSIFLAIETIAAADKPAQQDFFDMSLTELMNVEVDAPATITEKNPLKTPASVTRITAEDIARTPARNILDLLEIYVPGAFYMNHSVGPLPGIRGILVDRPYKFLVNVNGVNVNIKAHYGARLELLNWDLNDIDRIEIVRGPGSVTYGPGAIGGVINIYTKSGQQAPGVNIGGALWDKYNSIGNYVSYGKNDPNIDIYSYFSLVHTDGVKPDLFGVDSSTSGYVGGAGRPYGPNPPFTYMADYFGEPQIKAHVDVHLKNDWRFWARYNTASSSLIQGSAVQYLMDGKYEDFRQTRYRYLQFALEKKSSISDAFDLESLLGFSSIDVHDVEKWDSDLDNSRNNLQNILWIWSENEYYTRFMLKYKPEESAIKAALGFELSYDTIGPAWGKDKDNGLRLADGIMSGPTSEAYGTSKDGSKQYINTEKEYFDVGNGWETWSHAFLGELNITLSPKTTTLLSARLDRHSYTDYLLSPRFAWIYELDKDEYLKFIAQRSVRMNTQEELYMNEVMDKDNDPEKLDTLELIYSGKLTERLSLQTSTFYNQNEVIAWDWNQRRSASIGTLKTIGVEVETLYKNDGFALGLNHSFVKQLDWDLDSSVAVSGISYSDYYQNAGGGVVITSKGNDLNNWPTNATKLFTNIDFLEKKLTFHADARLFWGFKGSKIGLDALEEAGGNRSMIDAVRGKDAYKAEIAANLSLTYRLNKSASVMVFVQNIPILGDNKRYSYSSGFKKSYPDKVSWIEEPTVFGITYNLRF
jgi:outer membrane receptor protein involved in Fe transport